MATAVNVCVLDAAQSAALSETGLFADMDPSFNVRRCSTSEDAIGVCDTFNNEGGLHIVITKLGRTAADNWLPLVTHARALSDQVFIIVHSHTACGKPRYRQDAMDAGANMVSCDNESIARCIASIWAELQPSDEPCFPCPHCSREMTAEALWWHAQMFHSAAPSSGHQCPICGDVPGRSIQHHLFTEHRPATAGDTHENAAASKWYAFAMLIVRHPHSGRFLLVHECEQSGWYLPGGRVDPGETFERAAVRECMEEAGVKVTLTGVLRVATTPHRGYVRQRVIFLAEPEDPLQLPKSIPDHESVGASWVGWDEIQSGDLVMRGPTPVDWCGYVAEHWGSDDFACAPMSLLHFEGAPPGPH